MDVGHGQEVGQARQAAGGSYPRPALPGYMIARVLDFRLAYLADDGRWTYDPREGAAWVFGEAMTRSKQLGRCLVLLSAPVDDTAALVAMAECYWQDETCQPPQEPQLRRRWEVVNKVLGSWERDVRQVATTADDRHRPA